VADFWLVKVDGKLRGLTERDEKRYQKLRFRLNEMEDGEAAHMGGLKFPRSRKHFGFFFCKLRELFDRQERFDTVERLLDWLKIGAGYAELVPTPNGPCALPLSISWDECDEQTFIEVAQAIDGFLWTDYAQETLWPHLRPAMRHENIQGWHEYAEEQRRLAVLRKEEEGRA
jgi:hypothetical protein